MTKPWRFHHGAVSVPDIEEAARWYGNMLGFERENGFTLPDGTKALFLLRDAMRIELFEVPSPKPMPEERRHPREDLKTLGNKHFCFEVDDYDAVFEDLVAKGADVALTVGAAGGKRGFFIRDCVGGVVEILEAPKCS